MDGLTSKSPRKQGPGDSSPQSILTCHHGMFAAPQRTCFLSLWVGQTYSSLLPRRPLSLPAARKMSANIIHTPRLRHSPSGLGSRWRGPGVPEQTVNREMPHSSKHLPCHSATTGRQGKLAELSRKRTWKAGGNWTGRKLLNRQYFLEEIERDSANCISMWRYWIRWSLTL